MLKQVAHFVLYIYGAVSLRCFQEIAASYTQVAEAVAMALNTDYGGGGDAATCVIKPVQTNVNRKQESAAVALKEVK